MALKQTIAIKFVDQDVTFTDAYIRVSAFQGDKKNVRSSVDFLTAAEGDLLKREDYSFEHNLLAGNVLSQTYNYLKTLPEFANAVDC